MTRQSILIWVALLITLALSWHTYQQEQLQENGTKVVLPTRVLSQQQVMHTASEPTLRLSARQSVQSQLD